MRVFNVAALLLTGPVERQTMMDKIITGFPLREFMKAPAIVRA
jgi:hypothetical protein